MSYQTNRNWYYYLNGRDLQLYQLSNYGNVAVVAGKRVRLPEEPYGNQLIYPNEDITNGLRIEYTALDEPFISEALETTTARVSSSTINFQVAASAFFTDATGITFTVFTNGGSDDTITGFTDPEKYFYVGQSILVTGASTGGNNQTYTVNAVSSSGVTVNETIAGTESGQTITVKNNGNAILGGAAGTDTFTDFTANDKIRIIGSASNDADYTISSKSSNGDAIVPSSAPSAVESAGESITVYQIFKEDTSPSESSHVNLNRMLSLACVDFVRAMVSDAAGDIKKIGDNESNKRKISMTFPTSPYAIR